MTLLKNIFVIAIGLLMAAAYLSMLLALARFTDRFLPSFGFLFFLAFAVISALILIKLQTSLERYLIGRHVANHPNSSWRYVVIK